MKELLVNEIDQMPDDTTAQEWDEIGDFFGFEDWPNGLYFLMRKMRGHLRAAINYTLPRFTFRDHLKDCFGWLPCPDIRKPMFSQAKLWQAYLSMLFIVALLWIICLLSGVTP